jgi:hypothetical protein
MEINSQPDRIDLKDVHARLAREKGVRMVIDTDAHSTAQLENIRYGVFAARRAGLTRHDVLNTLPYERFVASLRKPGAARAPAKAGVPARPTRAAKRSPARATPSRAPAGPRRPARPAARRAKP